MPFAPDYISPPGETLQDCLDERGWSAQDLADASDELTKGWIDDLISGEFIITPYVAKQLERSSLGPASFWLERERKYREAILIRRARDIHEK